MGLIVRTWNVFQGIATTLVSFFERRNPEALLELEKENLRKLIGRFNEGLIAHAALSERLMTQVTRGETELADLTGKVRPLVKAGNDEAAARYALQRKQVAARLEEDRKELGDAENTFQKLVRTRDASVAEARSKIEQVRRQIGDLKVKRALADLENMTADMVGELGSANDSFNRLQEMVEEERDKASARARVGRRHLRCLRPGAERGRAGGARRPGAGGIPDRRKRQRRWRPPSPAGLFRQAPNGLRAEDTSG